MTKLEIISAITNYVNKSWPAGATAKDFYIGIATDAQDRLFNDHKVDEKTDIWIWCPANSDQIARDIEKHFLDLGMDGGPGGGDENTTQVYCFYQNEHTIR